MFCLMLKKAADVLLCCIDICYPAAAAGKCTYSYPQHKHTITFTPTPTHTYAHTHGQTFSVDDRPQPRHLNQYVHTKNG